jgi:4'-phosphopantetheinyl transferase
MKPAPLSPDPLVPLREAIAFEPAVPVRVRHAVGPLTIAIVSVAWLRSLDEATLAHVADRHLTADRAEWGELRFRKRRLEWLAGRIAVKRSVAAFSERYDARVLDPASIRVGRVGEGPFAGRPYVHGGPAIALSHSGDFAIAAAAPRSVGLDLERATQMTETHVRYALSPREESAPAAARPMPLVLRWACKEALLKLFGVGLRLGMQVVDVVEWTAEGRFGWRAAEALERVVAQPTDARLHGSWASMISGYALALAWR